jgi:hypothetical protein
MMVAEGDNATRLNPNPAEPGSDLAEHLTASQRFHYTAYWESRPDVHESMHHATGGCVGPTPTRVTRRAIIGGAISRFWTSPQLGTHRLVLTIT